MYVHIAYMFGYQQLHSFALKTFEDEERERDVCAIEQSDIDLGIHFVCLCGATA